MIKIGVLALQGAFAEHIGILQQLGVVALPIHLTKELTGLDGLILPGGESTTISTLAQRFGLLEPLRELAQKGLPILGTCAGMIFLAKEVSNSDVTTLKLMNIGVKRNALGRQVDSFEADLTMPVLGEKLFHAIFIRAPIIEEIGPEVEILAQLPDGIAVATRQGKLLASAFHPELGHDLRFHSYFLDIVNTGGV
jgi:5'-phosphate synthase pdxT subunit